MFTLFVREVMGLEVVSVKFVTIVDMEKLHVDAISATGANIAF
jgi:hypothetical protein